MLRLERCINFVRVFYGLELIEVLDAKRPGSIFSCVELGLNSLVYIERDGTCDLFLNGKKESCLTLYDVFLRVIPLEI